MDAAAFVQELCSRWFVPPPAPCGPASKGSSPQTKDLRPRLHILRKRRKAHGFFWSRNAEFLPKRGATIAQNPLPKRVYPLARSAPPARTPRPAIFPRAVTSARLVPAPSPAAPSPHNKTTPPTAPGWTDKSARRTAGEPACTPPRHLGWRCL